jgi:uncharacterized membrane protein
MNDVIWIVLAVIGWGSWSVFSKLAVQGSSPLMVPLTTAYVYSALAPIMYMTMKAKAVPIAWTTRGVLWTTCATLSALLANYSFLFAVQTRSTTTVVALTQVYPIVTFFLCWTVLGEAFTVTKLVGMVLLVSGAVLMSH